MQVKRYALITFLVVFFAAGCSQTTYKAATYRQTVTTYVELTTNVPAQVWITTDLGEARSFARSWQTLRAETAC